MAWGANSRGFCLELVETLQQVQDCHFLQITLHSMVTSALVGFQACMFCSLQLLGEPAQPSPGKRDTSVVAAISAHHWQEWEVEEGL